MDDVEVPAPFVSNRSLRTIESGIETKDPLVANLADAGESDPEYSELMKLISGEIKSIGKDSSYTDCKSILPFLSVSDLGNGKKIIVKNSHEVLIPVNERKNLVDLLHSTHMSADTMIRSAKGSFTWPGLKNDLGKKYQECNECLFHAKQKID